MSGPKHTPWAPGPWRVKELPHCKGKRRLVETASGRVVAEVPGSGWAPGTADANAQLIAAAPRLAEALQRLLNSRHPYAPELHHTEAFRKYVVAESFAREALREAGVEQ